MAFVVQYFQLLLNLFQRLTRPLQTIFLSSQMDVPKNQYDGDGPVANQSPLPTNVVPGVVY